MKLSPTKCIMEKGIKVNPEKIQVLCNMPIDITHGSTPGEANHNPISLYIQVNQP